MGVLISLVRGINSYIRWGRFTNRGTKFFTKYEQNGNASDLTEAIGNYQNALILCPPGHPDRFASLNNLANAIQTRYDLEGNLHDLTRAIQYHEEALDLCPPGNPDRPTSLNNLAVAIETRFERDGDLADLTRAIEYNQEALDLCPPGHPDRLFSLHNLANAIQTRYEGAGNLDDLARAVQYNEEALALIPPGHPNRPTSLNNLAGIIRSRYEREGNLDDLTRAIQYHEEALDLCPPGHRDRSASLTNLANAVRIRYELEGNPGDLTLAIQCQEEALDIRPPGHPERFASLNNLANVIHIRYEREGNLDDITRVIQYHEKALDLCPPGHLNRPCSLDNLANAIQTRFEREGNLDDLTIAIQYHEEALDLRPPGQPDRSASLNNLANAIRLRYEREGNLDDLTRAIQYYQGALDMRPPGHPDRSTSLSNLAKAIMARYKREGNLADLTFIIQYNEEALALRPPGHPDRSDYLLNLAKALHTQYSRTDNVDHTLSAASLDLKADTFEPLEPVDHPSSERDSRDASRRRIISLLREASQSANCPPKDCLEAALNWVSISSGLAPESTLDAYASALDQLDLALAIAQSLNQRHNRLLADKIFTITKDLGVDAAIWALKHGGLERAVELLERGRCLLFAQIGRYRVELDDLRLAKPELADRFARLSQLLDASTVSSQKLEDVGSTIKDPQERYRKVSMEWTQAVEEIRGLRSFDTFLKPTPYEQLRLAAVDGPIIILIPGAAGTAALIIRNNAPIHHIDLPHATSSRLAELSGNFTRVLNHKEYSDTQRERECVDNLASLWNDVVGPVAEALQRDLAIPLRSRVWWCPASVACFLPLHAAGLYAKAQAGKNFPNKYISSYTATLQALLRARRSKSTAQKKLLIITQPHTPGELPLPYAEDEADMIAAIVSSADTGLLPTTTPLLSEAGTREAVQREMAFHSWIHFICHGVQKASQPLDSYLSLHDGPLTLCEIIEKKLPNADFAYLAACHSAAGDQDLANEALHLAAAMQFAGFRGVVGTLWKMRDVDGPPLAEAFYKDMVKRGDHRRAAAALSKAINHLRRNKVPIHCWMRFIHIGA